MKKNMLLLVILILAKPGFGQSDSLKRNSVFAELGGPAVYYQIGYSRDIVVKKNWGLATGAGLGAFRHNDVIDVLLPVQLNVYYKLKRHKLEFGLGLTTGYYHYLPGRQNKYDEIQGIGAYLFGVLGYKYALFNNRCYIGVAFTPVLASDNEIYSWGALHVGYNF